jgi:hypothetical protein
MAISPGIPANSAFPSDDRPSTLLARARRCWGLPKHARNRDIRNYLLAHSVRLANMARLLEARVPQSKGRDQCR